MIMKLEDLESYILHGIDSSFNYTKRFNYKRFDPDKLFKNHSVNEDGSQKEMFLSYSTLGHYKECKFKFLIRNVLGLSFFKQSESLFVGNIVHKFLEMLVKKYEESDCNPSKFKDILIDLNQSFTTLFDKKMYSDDEMFVKELVNKINDRNKFEPDIFFDDYSYLNYVASLDYNYYLFNKDLIFNGISLVRDLLRFGNKHEVKKFSVEDWFKFTPVGTKTTFRGKIDLYFSYFDKEDGTENKYMIVDYKTGKSKYFDWNQLNFYALALDIRDFSKARRYFFDIKENVPIKCEESGSYEQSLSSLVKLCEQIEAFRDAFEEYSSDIRDTYESKINQYLDTLDVRDVHEAPFVLLKHLYDSCINGFFNKHFKGSSDTDRMKKYFPSNKVLCKYCDYFAQCPRIMK